MRIVRVALAALLAGVCGFEVDDAEARGFKLRFSGRGLSHAGGVLARKSYGPNVLTVDKLTECLRTADSLDNESATLEQQRDSLTARQDALKRQKADVEIAQAILNRYRQVEIDRFNRMVDEFNGTLAVVRREQDAFNIAVASFNARAATFNQSCGSGQKYYADDLEVAKASLTR